MTLSRLLTTSCVLLALGTAAACDSDRLLGPGAPQGIEGLVLIGPQCPVQTLANPCPDLPHQAWIEFFTADGASVTRLRSDTDGEFRVGLEPGTYRLQPESGSPFPVASDQEVEVLPGIYTQVTVSFDTGIR